MVDQVLVLITRGRYVCFTSPEADVCFTTIGETELLKLRRIFIRCFLYFRITYLTGCEGSDYHENRYLDLLNEGDYYMIKSEIIDPREADIYSNIQKNIRLTRYANGMTFFVNSFKEQHSEVAVLGCSIT